MLNAGAAVKFFRQRPQQSTAAQRAHVVTTSVAYRW